MASSTPVDQIRQILPIINGVSTGQGRGIKSCVVAVDVSCVAAADVTLDPEAVDVTPDRLGFFAALLLCVVADLLLCVFAAFEVRCVVAVDVASAFVGEDDHEFLQLVQWT